MAAASVGCAAASRFEKTGRVGDPRQLLAAIRASGSRAGSIRGVWKAQATGRSAPADLPRTGPLEDAGQRLAVARDDRLRGAVEIDDADPRHSVDQLGRDLRSGQQRRHRAGTRAGRVAEQPAPDLGELGETARGPSRPAAWSATSSP